MLGLKRNTRQAGRKLAVATALLMGLAAPSMAMEPVQLTMASFKVGSSWNVYAVTIGDILRKSLPKGSVIDTPPLGGGHANALIVAAGKADIALSHAMANRWARSGSVAYEKPQENLRALVGGLDVYYMTVVAAAKAGTGIREYFNEVNPDARIGLNPRGSVATFGGELILALAGASEEELSKRGGAYSYIPIPSTKSGFADGSIQATPQIITVGHPMITEISQTNDVTVLAPEPDILEGMMTQYGYGKATLPANSFRGQPDDVVLPSTTSTIIVRDDMSDELAYSITKALVENKERLVAGHKSLADFVPEDAWKAENVKLPLHPGAEKYYRERGWLK